MSFHISPSGLEKFFACPAAYDYGKRWRFTGEQKPWFVDGLAVHRWMADDHRAKLTPKQKTFVEMLQELVKKGGYILDADSELRQTAILSKDILIDRVIDRLATLPDGRRVVIDWKTATTSWAMIQICGKWIAPQSMGFQATSYLLEPEGWEGDWPKEIHFLVAPSTGISEVLIYKYQRDDRHVLLRAAKIVKTSDYRGWFPEIRGYRCRDCDFQLLCYQDPTYLRYFRRKKEESDAV